MLIDDPDTGITDAEDNESSSVKIRNLNIVVGNTPGAELPHTGGIGTTIFYILGSLLVISSAIVLISRRRIRN